MSLIKSLMKRNVSEQDLSDEDYDRMARCRPYSMTSWSRLAAMVEATRYISRKGIPGCVLECGVWRGGSVMAAMLTILEEGLPLREFCLFDTYEGMPAPSEEDIDFAGVDAAARLEADDPETGHVWAKASLEEVRGNIESTGYPMEFVRFVPGPVEETISRSWAEPIALLRLDTDWYSSTKHELNCLYPSLSGRGVLIVDDYGYWKGSRKAVDEYFAENDVDEFFFRIDNTGRLLIKSGD